MTPEQQIRRVLTSVRPDVLPALDRLVAERDEATELARSHNQARLEEEILRVAAEGRVADLRDALLTMTNRVCDMEGWSRLDSEFSGPYGDPDIERARSLLAAAVPAADPTPPEEEAEAWVAAFDDANRRQDFGALDRLRQERIRMPRAVNAAIDRRYFKSAPVPDTTTGEPQP